MFLGHFGLGFAGKRAAPAVSLGTLFLAVQWADLLFFVFCILGIEDFRIDPGSTRMTPMDFYDYPYSHSLLALAIWGLVVGGTYGLLKKNRRAGVVLAVGVLSHWVLDVLMHRPDMPIAPPSIASAKVGLSIWNHPMLTVILELLVYGGGILVYVRTTRPVDRTGSWALWSLVVFLAVVWAGNAFGPPPANERVVSLSGVAMWLFIPWGYWIDRHRAIVLRRTEA
jgi:hypothetical protein